MKDDKVVDDWLLSIGLSEDDDFEIFDDIFEIYPEIAETPDEIDAELTDVQFTETKIMWERLKEQLKKDGVWRYEA